MVDTLLLRPEEAARELGIGRSKAYELIRSGELPVIRIGRSVRIPIEPLKAWINERAAVAANDNGSKEGTDEPRPVRRRA
jgi:excisionase family DNA binding protein